MVSFLLPQVGQVECCCSFQRWRFLPVAQNSEFHLIVSIWRTLGRDEKAEAIGFQAMVLSAGGVTLYLLVQYWRRGFSDSAEYSEGVNEDVIFVGGECELMRTGPYSLYKGRLAMLTQSKSRELASFANISANIFIFSTMLNSCRLAVVSR